ncbi:hypothetical protein EON65_58265 [archaeon]|nr:MAG: hypothetical protein EON65_58265 [archaeon]
MQSIVALLLLSVASSIYCARLPVINAEGVIKSVSAIQSNLDEVLSQSDVVNAFSCVGIGESSEVFGALVDDDVNLNEQGVLMPYTLISLQCYV